MHLGGEEKKKKEDGKGREKKRYGETHREKQRASELGNKIDLKV